MTDSKTPDWAKAVERAISRLQALGNYAARPAWDRILREELDAVHSQALSAVDQRAYARGIEEAAKVGAQFIDGRLYKPKMPACSYHSAELATAIRQLLEVKG